MRVVVNTTPLICLAIINKLALLEELYGEIYIPSKVFEEAIKEEKLGSKEIEIWGKSKVSFVKNILLKNNLMVNLDEGEAEVITLALDIKADLVIIDENKGRLIARYNGLKVSGTIGILLDAKRQGKLSSIKGYLDKLIYNGIYIGKDLYQEALILAEEEY